MLLPFVVPMTYPADDGAGDEFVYLSFGVEGADSMWAVLELEVAVAARILSLLKLGVDTPAHWARHTSKRIKSCMDSVRNRSTIGVTKT